MELLERFALREMDAFEALFRQQQADVYRWMMRIVRDHAAAEDLTMEAFWRAHKAHASFEPAGNSRGNFGAWMRRIATNLALDHLRDQIESAFRALPPKLRIVARLSLVEEVPHAEIAEALDISEGAVRTRVHRATHHLRETLRNMGARP